MFIVVIVRGGIGGVGAAMAEPGPGTGAGGGCLGEGAVAHGKAAVVNRAAVMASARGGRGRLRHRRRELAQRRFFVK